MKKNYTLLVAFLAVLFFVACSDNGVASSNLGKACFTQQDCGPGLLCVDAICIADTQYTDSDDGGLVFDNETYDGDETYPDTDTPISSYKDSDGDGIPDSVEGTGDTDGDGTPDYLDTDSDGDGISDDIETPNNVVVDTDHDGTPDYKDTDSDGDTIPDSVEGTDDVDGDGASNYRDEDSDGDYIPDNMEIGNALPTNPIDSDGDGTPDYLDTDSDNDTVEDKFEGFKDVDKDGIPNFLDTDADGDGILDKDERGDGVVPLDTDNDGQFDFADPDSDNDGLGDGKEIFCANLGKDAKFYADVDGDGFSDMAEQAVGSDMCDPNQGVTDMPGIKFYFELPYNKPEKTDVLNFAPTVKMADIWFNVDTTGSMGGEIGALKASLSNTIIPGIRARITDSAFGVAWFNDPAVGISTTSTTDTAVAQASVNNLAAGVPGSGGDCDEQGYLSLTNMANSTGWRERAIPMIMHISDAPSKPTRDTAVNALVAKGIKVIGVFSAGGCSGDIASVQQIDIANATGAVVPACAGAGRTTLKYDIGSDGSGLGDAVINGVDALVKYSVFDLYTDVVDDGDPATPDTSLFIKKVEALEYIAPPEEPEHSCAPTAVPAAFNGSLYNNGFSNFSTGTASPAKEGSTLKFTVIAKNDFYEPKEEAKAFTARINIVDAKTGAVLDIQDVTIIVPPLIQGQDD